MRGSGCDPLTPDDIAEIIVFAATRKENVVLADSLVFPNHQVSPHHSHVVAGVSLKVVGFCNVHAPAVNIMLVNKKCIIVALVERATILDWNVISFGKLASSSEDNAVTT
jgi:hypothetical protein